MEKEELDAFVLTDENGENHHFVLLGELSKNNKRYWICEEIVVAENGEIESFGDIYPFRITEDNGELYVDTIDDEEEFIDVSNAWNEMVEGNPELQQMLDMDSEGEVEK
ncbi:MAG: DUF1292 domain-containing protein [Thermotogae bacterium]|nr:DUF1292 domain-containing protein [Thermotogaceae bacterium]RKX37256.1 MAG: DUF1292 domain-containing protein [Thermotogota bacterium]